MSEPVPPAAPDGAVARKLRVLIVDDNRDAADMLQMLLSMQGYETGIALDGQQALDRAAELRPDVILLDIGLPDLNGYEVCRRIRAQPWGKSMLIAAQTGWGGDEDRERSLAAGCDVHLTKPVEPSIIFDLLASRRGMDSDDWPE